MHAAQPIRTNALPRSCAAALLAVFCQVSGAQSVATPTAAASVTMAPISGDQIRAFIARQGAPAIGRVEVTVGEVDPRLQLAPCAAIEPFLPPGARLWGRSHVGLRCVRGAHWSVLLPVTVAIHGPALVAQRPIAAGSPARAEDFRLSEVELTRENVRPLSEPGVLEGQVMTRAIGAGQTLRADHLRQPPLVSAGDPVKVRLLGEGFAISTEGVALAQGTLGQGLKVRMESGKVVNGIVRDKFVEIRL